MLSRDCQVCVDIDPIHCMQKTFTQSRRRVESQRRRRRNKEINFLTTTTTTTTQTGSGPAYFFALVEHLIASATALGLAPEQATRLAKQTCLGAGRMLAESAEDPSQLRRNVTSPKGTTEAALKSFEASGLAESVDKAVKAAVDRAGELGKTLGS